MAFLCRLFFIPSVHPRPRSPSTGGPLFRGLVALSIVAFFKTSPSVASLDETLEALEGMTAVNQLTRGLCLTHNCLRVHRPDDLTNFYISKFGMRLLGNLTTESGEKWTYLGFAESPGILWNPTSAYLELRYNPNALDREPYAASKNDVYWKIGVTTPDVNEAASRLRDGEVVVANGRQLEDIGFLTNLSDPEGFSIELLQHDFEKNFNRSTPSSSLSLGFPLTLGQITLRVAEAEASLQFYCDRLGMRLLSRQRVPNLGFTLYFLAWTDEEPPNQDVDAVENREWLWKRPYTTLELQHGSVRPRYNAPEDHEAGFMGLRAHSSNVRQLSSYFESLGLTIENRISDHDPFSLPAFTVRDPDGVPITFNQIAL